MHFPILLVTLLACGPPEVVATGTPDCASGYWVPAGTLVTPHFEHLMVPLPGGRALVVGGHPIMDTSTAISHGVPESQVWDPDTETWHLAGPIDPAGASNLVGVVLPDGRVMIAGYPDFDTGDHVALFDPEAEAWAASTSLPTPRFTGLTTIGERSVVLAGGALWEGETQAGFANVEIFDTVTETWAVAAPLSGIRMYGSSVELPDGDLLIVGGLDGDEALLATAERFNPESGTWRSTTPMNEARTPPLVLLDDGRVLAVGGTVFQQNGGTVTSEVYDPEEETWSLVGSMSIDRHFAPFTKLADGSVLVSGGTTNDDVMAMASTERFDPATNEWTPVADLLHARAFHGAALLDDGSLLVAGGMFTSVGTFDLAQMLEAERFVCPQR